MNFITFHFYGLFHDMIINQELTNDFENVIGTDDYIYVSKFGDYTAAEFYDLIKKYLSQTEFHEFFVKIMGSSLPKDDIDNNKIFETNILFSKRHVNFIEYLSIVNRYLLNNKLSDIDNNLKNFTAFDYVITNFNNNFGDNDLQKSEYRRLLGIGADNSNLIFQMAKIFTDYCLQISYARENIKCLIQQYSLIGTNRIITDVVRDYFVKNYSSKKDWRYVSNTSNLMDKYVNLPLNELNYISDNKTISKAFEVNLIEYYDLNNYFNIQAELPSCIVGYEKQGSILSSITYVTETDTVSTWVTDKPIVSSINDSLGFSVPSYLLPAKEYIDVIISGNLCGRYEKWTPEQNSIDIPKGTTVSSIVPAGTVFTSSFYVDNLVPITGLCANFVTDYNNIFWRRDFSDDSLKDSEIIKAEIEYYKHYFDCFQNVENFDDQYEIYKNEVYPLLSASWQLHSTSGFLTNSELSGFQLMYSGEYPGHFTEQNHANKTFTTIASQPFLENLRGVEDISTETSLYLARPFYENVAYYISLLSKDILNMLSYNNKTRCWNSN